MNAGSRLRFSPSHPRRQQGNTLVGIIIGLVIGLGIAVVVALVISKGNTPFTDKASKAKNADASAEAADPNKPMYGNKNAPKPVPAKEFKPPMADALQEVLTKIQNAPTPVAAVKPEPEPRAEPHPAPAGPAPAGPAPARPLPEAEAPPEPKPAQVAKADTAEPTMVYYLQVGAFRETVDAESARAKLALLGFEAAITERVTDVGVLHRVRMGPYTQAEAMNRVRSKLSENGVDVAVIRNQK
ncbi:MAG: SPOR domain-containing protein [Pseudomonadota bacterium]